MLTKTEFITILDNRLLETCPPNIFTFSESKIAQFWRQYREGTGWEIKFEQSIKNVAALRNFPLFWYRLGITDLSLIKMYSSSMAWRTCKICDRIYNCTESAVGEFKASNTCSLECNSVSRINQGRLVSKARNEYNSRDAVQYSAKHGVSLENATEIIDTLNNSSTVRRKEYWLKRGYSETDAIELISNIQKQCSPRNKEYWIFRGMVEEDAIKAVSLHQSETSKKRGPFDPKSSWLCIEYYIAKGHTSEEGYALIKAKLLISGKKLREIAAKKTREERLSDNPRHISFYIKRGISEEHGIKRIIELNEYRSTYSIASAIANEFNEELVAYFLDDRQYTDYLNKEFCTYSREHKRAFFFDYVNVSKKFVVEFNGNYWHSSLNKRWTQEFDDLKVKVMEDRGYKVFVVWENDYRNSLPGEFVRNTVKEIKDWYENCEH